MEWGRINRKIFRIMEPGSPEHQDLPGHQVHIRPVPDMIRIQILAGCRKEYFKGCISYVPVRLSSDR